MRTLNKNSSEGIKIIFIIIITALLSGGIVYLALFEEKMPVIKGQNTTETIEKKSSQEENTKEKIDMPLAYIPEGRQTFYGANTNYIYQMVPTSNHQDQTVLRYNQDTQKTEVLIESMKEKYPELKGYLLTYVTHFDTRGVFQSYLPDSDAPPGSFYSLDLNTLALNKMKINAVYGGADGVLHKAPSGNKFLWIPLNSESQEAQTMYLLNLEQDTYKELLTLKNDESFSGGHTAFLGFYDSIEWMDDNKIRYAVFDQKLNNDTNFDNFYKALVEYRELEIV